jgi:hypothetical protein
VEDTLDSLYSSNRLPAPQYSYGSPPHTMLHSVTGAETLPALRLLPQ